MKLEDIQRFAATLPDAAPLFDTVHGESGSRRQARVNRRLAVDRDPAFGWNYIRTIIAADLELPRTVDHPILLRAYQYEVFGVEDTVIESAIALANPQTQECIFVKACLIDPSMSFEDVAARLNLSVEVVYAYHELFWNVKDRMTDEAYITKLIWPDTRIVEDQDGYLAVTSPEMSVLRCAYHNGAEAALAWGGMVRRPYDAITGNMDGEFKRQIMGRAISQIQGGMLNHNSRAISIGSRFVSSALQSGMEQETKNETAGIETLGASIYQALLQTASAETLQQMEMQTASLKAKNITPPKT